MKFLFLLFAFGLLILATTVLLGVCYTLFTIIRDDIDLKRIINKRK